MPPVYNGMPTKSYRTLEFEHKDRPDGWFLLGLKTKRKTLKCPCCGGGRLRSKGIYRRRARHLLVCGRESRIEVCTQRYRCVDCGRTFVPPMPGIKPGRHSTEPLRQQIARDHHEGICGSALARLSNMGSATIERIYAEFTRRKAAERESLQCPMVLGIDEHTLHKKQRFATTFCDLRNHKVFDIVPGKSEKDLVAFLARLQGREKVKVICIDLSNPYRRLIQRWFPNARIVADRFHVVRLIQHHFLALCREVVDELKEKRGVFSLLRARPENLSARQLLRLEKLFIEHPVLRPIYDQMHRLRALMNQKSKTKKEWLSIKEWGHEAG